MQVTKKLYLCALPGTKYNYETYTFDKVVTFVAWEHQEYSGYPAVAEAEVTFEVSDNLGPTELKVAELLREKTKLMAEFNNRITEIQAEINQLTAIESNLPGVDYDGKF